MTEPRWKDQTQRDGVKMDVSLDLESQLNTTGSASDLREVLTNMIFNALDAMPGGGELRLKTYDDGGHVCISMNPKILYSSRFLIACLLYAEISITLFTEEDRVLWKKH